MDPALVTHAQQWASLHGAADLGLITGPDAESVRKALTFLSQYHPSSLIGGKLSSEEIGVAHLLTNDFGRKIIMAISAGAVFFGANTYIGNGPNFMVKAIADQQKVHTPSFVAYVVRFTVPFMLPMLLIVWAIFFRH